MTLQHISSTNALSSITGICIPEMPQQLNAVTGKAYTGKKNQRLQETARHHQFTENTWATMRQWNSVKQSIAKGQKGLLVLYYEHPAAKDENGFLQAKRVFLYNRCQLESYGNR